MIPCPDNACDRLDGGLPHRRETAVAAAEARGDYNRRRSRDIAFHWNTRRTVTSSRVFRGSPHVSRELLEMCPGEITRNRVLSSGEDASAGCVEAQPPDDHRTQAFAT